MDGLSRRQRPIGRTNKLMLLVSLFVCVGSQLFLGCRLPVQVVMNGNVKGDITTRIPTNNTAQPVRQHVIAGNHTACHKIAIIDVDGVLLNRNFKGMESMGENPVSLFHEKLSVAGKDASIQAVIIRINSPGGSVTASDLMRHDLVNFKQRFGKPVIASILDVGAGGGYLLASCCDQIVAHPTSVIGGVGVIINFYNMSDTLEQQNIQPTPVRSGEHIDLGSPISSMSKSGKTLMQEMAQQFHLQFQEQVMQSRNQVNKDALDGRVFTAAYAKSHGFIDDILYLDQTILLACTLAGINSYDCRVVMFRRNNDRALTEYDITPNTPISVASIPLSIPGLDRANLPHFLYLWQPDPSLEIRAY